MSVQKIELPLAQALSIEIAATSAIGRFATTRERVIVPRPFSKAARFWVQPQVQTKWKHKRLYTNKRTALAAHLIASRACTAKYFKLNSRTPRAAAWHDVRSGSKGEILAASTCFPLRLRQRTCGGCTLMMVSCHERKKAAAGLRTRRRPLTMGMIRSPQPMCRWVLNKGLGGRPAGVRFTHHGEHQEIANNRSARVIETYNP
jgi:hypothetical protein